MGKKGIVGIIIGVVAIIGVIITISMVSRSNGDNPPYESYESSQSNVQEEIKQGTTVEVNQMFSDNLVGGSGEDWFNFTIEKDGYININFTHAIIDNDRIIWKIYLYEGESVTCYGGESFYWGVRGKETNYTTCNMGVAAGTYNVKVTSGEKSSDVQYSITINYTEADNWETEINSTKEKANELILNEAKYGTSICYEDKDWYKVEIPKAGYISITFEHPKLTDDRSNWKMELYESDGITYYGEKEFSWYIYGQDNLTTANMGVSAGIYYVFVNGRGTGSWTDKDYSVTVNFTEADNWETEINSTKEKANELILNEAKYGTSICYEDKDWYKVEIPKAGYISITFEHPKLTDDRSNWKMELYESDGITYYGEKEFSWYIYGQDNLTTANMGVSAGIYYVFVNGRGTGSWTDKDYSVTVNFTEADNWETEANSTIETASNLPVNTQTCGTIFDKNDEDWYKIEITRAGYITIGFEHPVLTSSSYCWDMRLYMSDGITQYSGKGFKWSFEGNSAGETSSKMGIGEGTYYLKITGSSSYSTEDYKILINHTINQDWEIENNGSASTATAINTGVQTSGSIVITGDQDWYRISGSGYSNYTFDFYHNKIDTSSVCWKVTVYASDGTTVITTIDIRGNDSSVSKSFSASGTFYIRVTEGSYNIWKGGYNNSDIVYSFAIWG